MENNNKRNKIVTLTVIGIIVLLIVLVGATYAYFSAKSKTDTQTVNTAKVDLLVEIDEKATHIENIKPTTWYTTDSNIEFNENSNNEDIVQIPIKVTNNSTIDVNFDLNLQAKNLTLKEDDENGNKLEGGSLSDIKYKLVFAEDQGFFGTSYYYRAMGDFETPNYKHKLMANQSLKKDQSINYTLFIYIADTGEEQNKLQGITFDVEISANTTNPTSRAGETLADAIRKDNDIKNRKPTYATYPVYNSVDGSISEYNFFLEDNGLFKMQNSFGKDIYYFRGNVKNNRVYFGTLKEGDYVGMPILWKILRINDDNSITLMLGDSYQKYLSYYDDAMATNFKYSENGSTKYEESKVKQVLEEWYNKTFSKEEQAMIQETEFCNDTNYDAVLKRLNKDNPEPTLECSNEHKVSANIGLITADEAILAGGLYEKRNYPEIDLGILGTWTMTATSDSSMACAEDSSLSSYETAAPSQNFILPVITIKPDTKLLNSVTYNGLTETSRYGTYLIGPE